MLFAACSNVALLVPSKHDMHAADGRCDDITPNCYRGIPYARFISANGTGLGANAPRFRGASEVTSPLIAATGNTPAR